MNDNAINKDMRGRPQNCAAVLEDRSGGMGAGLQGAPGVAKPQWRRAVVASLVAVAALALGGLVWWRKATKGEPPARGARHAEVAIVDADGGVQLWEDGPYWAECNVGATKPEERGYYFWWGDTVGYKRNKTYDGWLSVKDGSGFLFTEANCPISEKDVTWLRTEHYVDASSNLVAAVDAATAHLGAPWRMPTDAEFEALFEKCTSGWAKRNGVLGRYVSGKGKFASKWIFLPVTGYCVESDRCETCLHGYYWSSTPSQYQTDDAICLDVDSVWFCPTAFPRTLGMAVRPIRGFAK